uniref:Uncharacterized protein n=1 Tax=Salix viminalis TaxID=40686 RepID=A0A6N2LMS9_SALVM
MTGGIGEAIRTAASNRALVAILSQKSIGRRDMMLSAPSKKGRFGTSCLWHPSIQETRSLEDL